MNLSLGSEGSLRRKLEAAHFSDKPRRRYPLKSPSSAPGYRCLPSNDPQFEVFGGETTSIPLYPRVKDYRVAALRRQGFWYNSFAARFSGLTSGIERSTIHVLISGGPAPSPEYCVTRYLFLPISFASYLHFRFGKDRNFCSTILISTDLVLPVVGSVRVG